MTEVVDIDNTIDKAIIKSLEFMCNEREVKGLVAGGIKNTIKEKFKMDKVKDDVIQSRIRALFDREILVDVPPSRPRKNKIRTYTLNKNIEFNYVCGPLPTEGEAREIPTEIRRHHSEGLQEAIKNWIEFFPEPNEKYPLDPANRYQNDIKKCQGHPLFSDLKNHLPEVDCNVFNKWDKYIANLYRLQQMKERLLPTIKMDISRCFEEFKLKFIDYQDYGQWDYIQKVLYEYVLKIIKPKHGQEAHDDYKKYLGISRKRACQIAIEFGNTSGMADQFRRHRGEDQKIFMKGINNFVSVLNNERSSLIQESKEIFRTIEKLREDRDRIIRELSDALQYYSFPGDCKYLAGY